MQWLSLVWSKFLKKNKEEKAPKFVTKNVYTSVKTGPLRATYTFTRYFDCTVQWLIVTISSLMALLVLNLIVSFFSDEPNPLDAYAAAPISFNQTEPNSLPESNQSADTNTALEFPSMALPDQQLPQDSSRQTEPNRGQSQSKGIGQGQESSPFIPHSQSSATGNNAAVGAAGTTSAGANGDNAARTNAANASRMPQAEPVQARINFNAAHSDSSSSSSSSSSGAQEFTDFTWGENTSLESSQQPNQSGSTESANLAPPQTLPSNSVKPNNSAKPAASSQSAVSSSYNTSPSASEIVRPNAFSIQNASSSPNTKIELKPFAIHSASSAANKDAKALPSDSAQSYTTIPMELQSKNMQSAWHEQQVNTTAAAGNTNVSTTKSAFDSSSQSQFKTAIDEGKSAEAAIRSEQQGNQGVKGVVVAKESQGQSQQGHDSASKQTASQASTEQVKRVADSKAGQSQSVAKNQGESQGSKGQGQGQKQAEQGQSKGQGQNASNRSQTVSKVEAMLQQNAASAASKADSPFPTTLVDPQHMAKDTAPNQTVDTALANPLVRGLSLADVIMRGLFGIVLVWRGLALYCIFHCGQGVRIDFGKRLITIWHNWTVETIVMTDVERIDVVEPAKETLSRKHIQRILPYLNIEGIQITYVTTNEEDEIPNYKTTLIKGYSAEEMQKIFDVLNQIY